MDVDSAQTSLPQSMRALVYSEPRRFQVEQRPLPRVRKHDVLIKVRASGVCGTDLHIHEGEFGAKFPLIPGHETVGVVAAFGSKVVGFSLGDRVVADNSEVCGHCHYCRRGKELFCENFIPHGVEVDGGFAEYAAYPAHRVFKFHNLSDVDATLIEPASCVAHGLDKIAPKMGSRILLFGAGPTGLMLAQMLRQNGGCHVVLAAPAGIKMELARSLSAADEYVELARGQQALQNSVSLLRTAYPYGFDIVVEATGSASILESAIDLVTKGGKLVVYGVYNDSDRIALSPNKIFKEEINIIGSFSQTYKFPAAIDYLGMSLLHLEPLLLKVVRPDSGRVKVNGIVNKTYRLEEWQDCLEEIRNKSVIKAALVFD
ncbi:hypothetical protein NW762_012002 [Fusarium torreyae]|uniref:Enoyl reductase (ER) domain-containing protein n=1 Tax=Fusarium torreyae TaxID=1237075 RepID=A0A9W8RPW5_9HYPO|nr:hypothetical protein NW762_012002 [Fusarium torreyae]